MSEDPPSLAAVPRAAAVAGVAFALLFGAALLMVRLSIPGSIVERGGWLAEQVLVRERDVPAELAAGEGTVDIAALEKEFIASAAAYASRKGISYGAFRSVGVTPAVLKAAGISRGA